MQFRICIENLNADTVQPSNPTPGILEYRNKCPSIYICIFEDNYCSIIFNNKKLVAN